MCCPFKKNPSLKHLHTGFSFLDPEATSIFYTVHSYDIGFQKGLQLQYSIDLTLRY